MEPKASAAVVVILVALVMSICTMLTIVLCKLGIITAC